jgi:hypothetical protein
VLFAAPENVPVTVTFPLACIVVPCVLLLFTVPCVSVKLPTVTVDDVATALKVKTAFAAAAPFINSVLFPASKVPVPNVTVP